MAGKNKGGREIRKPKQDKKAKAKAAAESTAVIPASTHGAKVHQSK
jgi:hypothetical protein